MTKLEDALSRAKAQLPNCVAIGYVDMAQGALLASRIDGSHPAEVLQLVAAATAEQMQGPTVTEIERQFAAHKGAKHVERMISELTFKTSSGLYHLILRCQRNPEHALVVVCGKGANPGMVGAKAAVALPIVEAAF